MIFKGESYLNQLEDLYGMGHEDRSFEQIHTGRSIPYRRLTDKTQRKTRQIDEIAYW